mmetsp:Transcript_39802/g.102524  ORF Transcript_39802/g.102524 Transcript_39802/m.102524 type:complete len:91 (-) Transcript_39802:1684-1956(-)
MFGLKGTSLRKTFRTPQCPYKEGRSGTFSQRKLGSFGGGLGHRNGCCLSRAHVKSESHAQEHRNEEGGEGACGAHFATEIPFELCSQLSD